MSPIASVNWSMLFGAVTEWHVNWAEIFVVGSSWFWLLLLAESILLIGLLEWDQGAIATLTLVATLCALQFMGDLNVLGYVVHHPWTVLLGAVGYFALGTGWAIAKWWYYVREQRGFYDELRSAFLRVHGFDGPGAMPDNLQAKWRECLTVAQDRRKLDVHPLVAQHKTHVLRWMSYWPWSLFWTVLKDPVRKAFLSIYYNIAEYLQEISDKAFKSLDADLPKEVESGLPAKPDPILAEFGVAELFLPNPRKPGDGQPQRKK